MAFDITTYTELKNAITNYAKRSDAFFTGRLDGFIGLVEARLNRVLNDRRKQTTASVIMTNGSGTLPTDYLAMRRVTWDGDSDANLEYCTPEYFAIAYPDGEEDTPNVYTVEGSTIKVRPVSSTSLSILYDQKVPALSGSQATNWVLTSHPDLYLAGCLAHAYAFTEQDDQAMKWQGVADGLIAELWNAEHTHAGPLVIRPVGVAIV